MHSETGVYFFSYSHIRTGRSNMLTLFLLGRSEFHKLNNKFSRVILLKPKAYGLINISCGVFSTSFPQICILPLDFYLDYFLQVSCVGVAPLLVFITLHKK